MSPRRVSSRTYPEVAFIDTSGFYALLDGEDALHSRAVSIFAALSDPVRRDILALLRAGEQPAGVLVETLNLPQPNVSKHLKALREAGLVQIRADGPRRLYSLDPRPLAELDQWLQPYREFWAGRLDALGDNL